MKDIGNVIKKKRLAMGLSRDKLAGKTGITPKSIVSIEGGSLPSTRTLFKILDALDLEMKIVDAVRHITHEEIEILVEEIAQSAVEGHRNVCVAINNDIDIFVAFTADIKKHREDDYCNGTGATIIDDASVSIINIDALSDVPVKMPCDKTDLEIYVAKKIMEG
jgi:transcriptional regulator with XRE-family HTH domain